MQCQIEQLLARLNSLVSRGGLSRLEKVELAEGNRDFMLLNEKISKLSAGDRFMQAAKRKEQVRLEDPISVP